MLVMAILKTYQQSPLERKNYTVKYSDWLEEGENITSVDATVVPVTDPEFEAIVGADPSDNTVSIAAGPGGVEGKTYSITFIIHTDDDQSMEDCILFNVTSSCQL